MERCTQSWKGECVQVAEEICIYRHTTAYLHSGEDPEALDVLYHETEVNILNHVSGWQGFAAVLPAAEPGMLA